MLMLALTALQENIYKIPHKTKMCILKNNKQVKQVFAAVCGSFSVQILPHRHGLDNISAAILVKLNSPPEFEWRRHAR